MAKHTGSRVVLVILEVAIGLTALYGGIAILTGVFKQWLLLSWLQGTAFRDYTIPGLALVVLVGGGMLLAAGTVFVRRAWTALFSVAVGFMLVGFEVVEAASVDSKAETVLVFMAIMQALYAALGLVIVVMATAVWWREHARGGSPPARVGGTSLANCTQCGHELRPDDRFCPECGARAPSELATVRVGETSEPTAADIETFKAVARHFRNDLQMFWQHTGFFMTVEAALFAVAAGAFAAQQPNYLLALLVGIVGFVLAAFWAWIAWNRVWLIANWRNQLMKLDHYVEKYRTYWEVETLMVKHPLRSPTAFTKYLPWGVGMIWGVITPLLASSDKLKYVPVWGALLLSAGFGIVAPLAARMALQKLAPIGVPELRLGDPLGKIGGSTGGVQGPTRASISDDEDDEDEPSVV